MSDTQRPQGPASGVLNSLSRIGAVIVGMVETRLKLIAIELEEEKNYTYSAYFNGGDHLITHRLWLNESTYSPLLGDPT